jgi:biopolymer transport protein TolR
MENQIINLFFLESRIKSYFLGKDKKVVFLKADKDVPYGYMIDVMDILKKAGIETVGLIVDIKKEEKK